MYRIAVVQNGVEVQHSGYVDAIPMYKRFAPIGREKAEFTRFSGVNIRDLFNSGEKYIMDFDALILGTNATSDDDVYNVLLEEQSRKLLSTFIESGKGLLICSQKKYQSKPNDNANTAFKIDLDAKNEDFMRILDDTGKGELYYSISEVHSSYVSKQRISNILPSHYEYIVDERPSGESSRDGHLSLVEEDRTTLNQRCIFSLPHKITEETLKRHCNTNSFQQHYYRDIIIPVYNSAYQSVIVDTSGDYERNLLMVAVPQKRERIVISTMALDWAGHEELLENIINYLTRGIPHTAFVHKNDYSNSEMKILTLDAELSKVGNMEYCSIEDYLVNVSWHSLVVFSPDFSESEVSGVWQSIKQKNKFTKVYHYRMVADELVLVKYSNNTYIEQQKMDVLAWLNSKRGKRLWDNSFWKTYDVARLLYTIKDTQCPSVVEQIIEAIIGKDDKNKEHYKENGSYDGVLAPTCGVMEILHWANYKEHYDRTRSYLLQKYREEDSAHNKMFIIRSFYRTQDPAITMLIGAFSFDSTTSFPDMIDLDVCLYAEIAIILYKYSKNNSTLNKQMIVNALNELLSRQMQNGKWDSLSNTATILIFLLQHLKDLQQILKDSAGRELLSKVKEKVDRGIAAIKTAYSPKQFNWENNIVTTANALLSLYLYDESSGYKSKDFLKHFVDESNTAANYNALNLALQTLDVTIDDLNSDRNRLVKMESTVAENQSDITRLSRRLYLTGMVAGFSLTCLVSICVQLALKVPKEFSSIVSEVFMWLPVAVGTVIPAIVFAVNKKINNIGNEKEKSAAQPTIKTKRGKK